MDNLGKAIYLAGFALLFVFAASVSIFLYSSVDTYLHEAVSSVKLANRAESKTNEDLSNFKREIPIGEAYITLYNMEQMHVNSVTIRNGVKEKIVVDQKKDNIDKAIRLLKDINKEHKSIRYSVSGSNVTYFVK